MTLLTRTGLLEGRRRPVARRVKELSFLQGIEAPICQAAPYSLRPLAALLNPYARGCSVLCNHPADSHSKDALRRMKETWPTEMRGGLLTGEGEGADVALPEELFRRYTDTDSRPHSPPPLGPPVVVAPLGPLPLRRCRTPDPQQHDQHQEGHRTLLVLDLRRSRSHDTLSMVAPSESGIWPGSTVGAPGLMSPAGPGSTAVIETRAGLPSGAPPTRRSGPLPAPGFRRAGRVPRTPCPSLAASRPASQATCRPGSRSRPPRPASQPSGSLGTAQGLQPLSQPPSPVPRSKSQGEATEDLPSGVQQQPVLVVTCAAPSPSVDQPQDSALGGEDDSASGGVRRRGKKRRGKRSGKDSLREPEKEIHGFPEPGETQVSAMGDEANHPSASARPSLTGLSAGALGSAGSAAGAAGLGVGEAATRARAIDFSFLDAESLQHLQRDLDQETVECEFDVKRRMALEEAYRLLPARAPRRNSQTEDPTAPSPPPQSGLLAVPRVFSLRSARFELPLDTKLLDSLTPLEYVTRHVEVCNSSAQLYRRVFNRHREGAVIPQQDDQQQQQQQPAPHSDEPKYILGQSVVVALSGVLGRPLTEAEGVELRERLGWQDSDRLEFRTWCGVCALAERLLAPRDGRDHPAEPRPELEQADLAGLQRRLARLPAPDPRLVQILTEVSQM